MILEAADMSFRHTDNKIHLRYVISDIGESGGAITANSVKSEEHLPIP